MLEVPLTVQGEGRRVVLVHGFSQCGEVWQDVGDELGGLGYEVLAPNLPGHGDDSTHDGADLWRCAELLGQTGGRAVYVGYSLGARVILHLALSKPELIEGAVLVGARTGLSGGERDARAMEDRKLADKIDDEGVESFLETWMQLGFNARLPDERRFTELRSKGRAQGWSSSMRNAGLGAQSIELESLEAIEHPVLVVTGEHDMPPVRASAERLCETLHHARHFCVEGVGHAVPFEMQPARFAALVDGYCRSL